MRPSHRLVFAALCLLSSGRWLLADALPSTLVPAQQQAIHFALLTGVFALASRKLPSVHLILPVVFVFVLPSLAFALAEGHITPTTQTVVFAFTPALVTLIMIQQTYAFGPESALPAKFVPALGGVLGLMLLLPATLHDFWVRFTFLVAAMIGAGLVAIRLHTLLRNQLLLPLASLVSGLTAIALAIASRTASWSTVNLLQEAVIACLIDAPILLLTLYLLRELHPISFATRFLLIPLLAVVEGLILLRPHPTPTLAAGLALTAAASVLLLRGNPPETT